MESLNIVSFWEKVICSGRGCAAPEWLYCIAAWNRFSASGLHKATLILWEQVNEAWKVPPKEATRETLHKTQNKTP